MRLFVRRDFTQNIVDVVKELLLVLENEEEVDDDFNPVAIGTAKFMVVSRLKELIREATGEIL